MHKFKKLKIFTIFVMIFAICASFLNAPLAMADSDGAADLTNRILYNMLADCYKSYIKSPVKTGGVDKNGTAYYENVEKSIFEDKQLVSDDNDEQNEHFITNDDDEVDDKVICAEVFKRIYSPAQEPIGSEDSYDNFNNVMAFLNSLGYTKVNHDEDRIVCVKYGWRQVEDGNMSNDKHLQGAICWTDPAKQLTKKTTPELGSIRQTAKPYSFTDLTFDRYKLQAGNEEEDDKGAFDGHEYEIILNFEQYFNGACFEPTREERPSFSLFYDPDTGEASFSSDSSETTIENDGVCQIQDNGLYHTFYFEIVYPTLNNQPWEGHTLEPQLQFLLEYKIDNYRDALSQARSYLSGGRYAPNALYLDISWQQIYNLYVHYLVDFYGLFINSGDCTTDPDNNQRVPLLVNQQTRFCKVTAHKDEHENDKVAVFPSTDGNNYVLSEIVGLDDLIKMTQEVFTKHSDEITPATITQNGLIVTPFPSLKTTRDNILTDECYMNGESLGWVLCPLVQFAGNAMASMYNKIIKNFLTIESGLMSQDAEKGGTYMAWQTFVGFANIIVIVFLLVVIFSQVTGVGIDNYGIKKALPKIIIAAVLINLSFILCQLLVDLSNIVGNSIEGLLSGIGNDLAKRSQLSQFTGWEYTDGGAFRFILDAAIFTAGAGVVLSVVSAFRTGGVFGLLIPLVFGLLIGLIAILFFFTLLGIRKAAVITLVAVSPVAFACYTLPNLKKQIFDRWFGLLKTMLLAYPLCGLVIGGANLASGILMLTAPKIESNNFLFYFINMLLMVVPFFFLPSLIRKSMGALGTLSQKATSTARRIGRNTRNRAEDWNRKRPAIQNRNAISEERRNQRWAQRRSDRGVRGPLFRQRQRAEVDRARQILAQQAETEAMRNVRVDDPNWLAGAMGQADVKAGKEQLDKQNYADTKSREGAIAVVKQSAHDQLLRNQRYAETNKTARTAFTKKLAAKHDADRREDENYASQMALDSSMQSNLAAAATKRQQNQAALLSAGKMEVNGQAVNQNDRASMRTAYNNVLDNLASAQAGSEEYRTAMAQAGALQDAMMRSGGGRNDLAQAYINRAQREAVNSNIKMAASNFLAAHESSLEEKNPGTLSVLKDVANDGITNDALKNNVDSKRYVADNIEEMSPGTLKDCDPEFVHDAVSYLNDIARRQELFESPSMNIYDLPADIKPPTADEIRMVERFRTEVVDKYFSSENAPNHTVEIANELNKLIKRKA